MRTLWLNIKRRSALGCFIPFGIALALPAHAAYVQGVPTTIKGISTYAKGAAAGDVLVKVHQSVPGCEAGYYLKSGAIGGRETLATALSAFQSRSRVVVNGFDSPRWSGSSAAFCEIEGVHLSE